MKSRIRSYCAATLVLSIALPGCMQSRVEESRELHTKIEKSEAVVILAKPQIEGAAAEDGFMDCVSHTLAGNGMDAISVRSNVEFVDSMFPWFEPGTAPTRPEGIATLLTRPGVSERVAASGVRYIVWLDGGTQKTDGGGSIACGAAPGAAGCIGFGWWEKESNYEATVWDLKQAKSAGSVDTNVTGTSAIVGAVVPLPFIARVQSLACNRMAGQLRTFFTGSDDVDAPQSVANATHKPMTLAARTASSRNFHVKSASLPGASSAADEVGGATASPVVSTASPVVTTSPPRAATVSPIIATSPRGPATASPVAAASLPGAATAGPSGTATASAGVTPARN